MCSLSKIRKNAIPWETQNRESYDEFVTTTPIHVCNYTQPEGSFRYNLKPMPSLSIPFPEGTRTVALRGNNITIGRLPDNAIQIRDRAISAYHAELILEGDHYRIHDRSSTNGIQVEGRIVSDYHLREDCQIVLGGLLCDFVAAAFPKSSPTDMDTLATRGEMHTILQSNGSLQKEVESLKTQVEAMIKAREATKDGDTQTVPLAQYDQLAADATALRASLQERQTQIERLSTLLAIAQRERDTLQKAYDDARAELAAKPAAEPTPSTMPPLARLAAPSEGDKSELITTVKVTLPPGISGPNIPASSSAPSVPRATPAAPAPAVGTPPPSLPKPPGSLGTGSPSRRPASGVMPAKTAPIIAGASAMKSTQKLSE